MTDDKTHDELNNIIKETKLPFYYPLPCAQPVCLTLIPDDQHRDFEMLTEKRNIHTPLIEMLCHDLLKAALTEEEEVISVKPKEKKKDILDIQADKEVCYEEIVQESFVLIDSKIVHPFDPSIEVDEVYELFPDKENLKNKFNILSVVEQCNMYDFVSLAEDKIPSLIFMDGKEFSCTAMDISDYVFVNFDGNKAVYSEIGANLKLKQKNK